MSDHPDTPALRAALTWILSAEGGDSDHAADSGGRTSYGISQYHTEAWADGEVTEAEAREIYARDYWYARGCQHLPLVLAIAVFDGEVNHRPRVATALLQQILGVQADGLSGPVTGAAAHRADSAAVLDRYLARRGVLYHDIVTADSSQAVFLEGWLWRLVRLHRYCLEALP